MANVGNSDFASNVATASNTAATSYPDTQSISANPSSGLGNSAQATNTNTASRNSAATAAAALASANAGSENTKNSQNGNGNGNGDDSGSSGGPSDSQVPATVAGSGNGAQPVPPSTYSGFLSQYVYIIPGKITRFSIINATFAAVTMSVLFKSFWCWVLAASRMMEPFYHLFRPTGASAEESLLLPYIGAGTAWGSLNPWNKRWVMLLTTCVAFMLSAMAELGSEAMTVRAGSTCTGTTKSGGRTLCDPQWVINMAVLRAIQATLGLAAALIAVLGYLNWPNRSGLEAYPASIASMADMLGHSDEELKQDLRAIDPKATDQEVSKTLAGKFYALTRLDSLSGDGKLQYGIKCIPSPLSRRTTTLESASKTPDSRPKRRAWYKRIPYSHILHTLLHIILFLIILLFLLNGNDTYIISLTKSTGAGAALVSLPFRFLDGTRFGPRFILSLLCVLLSRYWEEVEADVRILSPYRRLWKKDLSSQQLDGMKLHGVPVTMVWYALRAGNWVHACVAALTVMSYALVVLVVGVPYTYGEEERLNLISSAASVGVLGSMLIGLVGVWVWKLTGPKMARRPDTLVNVWLLLCGSGVMGEGSRHMDETEDRNEKRRFWYGEGVGRDEVERWMVDVGPRGGKG